MSRAPTLRLVGVVESALDDKGEAPKQADEGAPPATLRIEPEFAACCEGLRAGEEVFVFTWLDRADRSVQAVHPRGDRNRPLTGVFATRSPVRPNPIGTSIVKLVGVEGNVVLVRGLDCLDETPLLDIKPDRCEFTPLASPQAGDFETE